VQPGNACTTELKTDREVILCEVRVSRSGDFDVERHSGWPGLHPVELTFGKRKCHGHDWKRRRHTAEPFVIDDVDVWT
jgi:hypothetical protein